MSSTEVSEVNIWTWQTITLALLFIPLLKFIYIIIATIIKQCMPMPNLLERYCSKQKTSWAVVTGATDGVGLGFCQVLVSLGFNVLLISRNTDKLKKTEQNLSSFKSNPNSKLKSITFNFKDSASPQKWQQLLAQLRQLDIAILVNNVGTSDIGMIDKFSHELLKDIINVNCVAMAALTKEVINFMEKRNGRSAIINLSSFLGEKAVPYVTLYAATKAFNREFSNSIALQYPSIDVMCLKPMFVESPLSRQKKGFGVPDRRECAWDSLKELRWESESYGYYLHRLFAFMARNFIPNSLYRVFVSIGADRVFKSLYPQVTI